MAIRWDTSTRDPVTGKINMIPVHEPDPPDPRWDDKICFICGSTERHYRCLSAWGLDFCAACLPDIWNIRSWGKSSDTITLQVLIRHLWKESHSVRLRK